MKVYNVGYIRTKLLLTCLIIISFINSLYYLLSYDYFLIIYCFKINVDTYTCIYICVPCYQIYSYKYMYLPSMVSLIAIYACPLFAINFQLRSVSSFKLTCNVFLHYGAHSHQRWSLLFPFYRVIISDNL